MVAICIITTLLYLLLIGSFAFGFDRVSVFKLKKKDAKTTFSVIIPFRNEAENLPDLLASIAALKYPNHLYEIIFVDDDSEDDSVKTIMRFLSSAQNDIKVIPNKRVSVSAKKDAITKAVKQAKNDWIITTDADCVLPKYWLDSFDAFIQTTTSKCIVAPVVYTDENSFLNRFQQLDMLSLQGATLGGFGIKKPFLCNGANFAYQKELFKTLNGFEGNKNIASGDDIFLLEKALKKHPNGVQYLKCQHAVVTTKGQPNWNALKAQRVRWAAKTSAYNNGFGKLTGFVVLLMNTLIILFLPLVLFSTFNLKTFVYILVIKFSIDFLLIFKAALFFNRKPVLSSYFFGFLLYPFFSVYIAFVSMFTNYTWKGRRFKA